MFLILALENCKVHIYTPPKLKNSNHSIYIQPAPKANELFLWQKNTKIRYYFEPLSENIRSKVELTKLKKLTENAINTWQLSKIGISFTEVDDEYNANVTFSFEDQLYEDERIFGYCKLKPSTNWYSSCHFYSGCFTNDEMLSVHIMHQIGHMIGLEHTFEYTCNQNILIY